MRNYLSFGGGVNSVALYILMEQLGMDFEAVFVDHGGDYPETYEYVDYFISTGRPVTVLKPEYQGHTKILEFCQEKRMVPNRLIRWCTSNFKVKPLMDYQLTPCFVHIGIDAGEQRRAKLSSDGGRENRYLLIEHNIDRQGCKDLIAKAGLKVPPKSGCFFCPFQRVSQWRNLRRKHPELFCIAQKLEASQNEYRQSVGKPPFYIVRKDKPLQSVVNTAPNLWPEMDYPPCQCGL